MGFDALKKDKTTPFMINTPSMTSTHLTVLAIACRRVSKGGGSHLGETGDAGALTGDAGALTG